jgi:hypothetical protein
MAALENTERLIDFCEDACNGSFSCAGIADKNGMEVKLIQYTPACLAVKFHEGHKFMDLLLDFCIPIRPSSSASEISSNPSSTGIVGRALRIVEVNGFIRKILYATSHRQPQPISCRMTQCEIDFPFR